MTIDETAPVRARAAIDVAAPPEVVWSVLTDVERWPAWNPDVRSASLGGPLAPGTQFRWVSGAARIVSTIQEVEPARRIAWTGKMLGIEAGHVYTLERRDDGTRVTSEESWKGLLVRLFRGPMQRRLQSALDSGLARLQDEAQRRHAAGIAG